ncbi:hypothetical protein FACS1894133_4370 [Clostridia bacterium]|nr:hypothetical protein FACS1894133_4370 [Clostridia bacterium]
MSYAQVLGKQSAKTEFLCYNILISSQKSGQNGGSLWQDLEKTYTNVTTDVTKDAILKVGI